MKLTRSVCIDAPAPEVWAVLSNLEAIPVWVPAILVAHCPGQRRGVGALRVCTLKQATVRETIVEWDEGKSFTYRGEGAPMMKTATNRWSIVAHGAQTLVTSSSEVVLSGGVFGRLLEPLARAMAGRLGDRSLASLKYLVEHGVPFPGRQAELTLAPAGC